MPNASILALALAATLAGSAPADGPIGFLPGSRPAQAEAESRALAVPTPEKARAWLRTLTEEPHVAGTPADRKTADFIRDRLREWGWDADLAEYEVLLNYPKSVGIRLLRPTEQPLKTVEDAYAPDKDSASPAAFPAFHGYGVSGDVSGQVVYANYGRPEDFEALDTLGVDVKGKIVLVRYFGLFRGLKVLNAQKRGAIGVLIYSDPADDGYMKGDVYPNGPYRPPSGIQRGSVQFLSLGPGDPTTPGWASTKGAKRLPWNPANGFPTAGNSFFITAEPAGPGNFGVENWEKATKLDRDEYFATIPSLPISYEAARPILNNLGGPNVPSGWQGALPFAYHVGPGPAEVQFKVEMDYKIRTIWNVIATLKGSAEPDRWVMVGNHRDAWAYGAVDPGSGTAATLEMCRALGAAVKVGWTPRRTILYASWDAEEYGLVGSTEWAEDHADELNEKAVLMLNVDSAVSGENLGFDGIPSLRDFILQAAEAVNDPRTGKTLRATWEAGRRSEWATSGPLDLDAGVWTADPVAIRLDAPFEPQFGPIGSGSDYTVFLDHLGIPAVDADFGGHYGVYHSVYDDFFWMEHFGDPEFLTHATAARLYTAIVMRAAGADVVPLRFTPYAVALRAHVDDLRRLVAKQARSAEAPTSAMSFDGLPGLAAAVNRFSEAAGALDAATAELAEEDEVAAERLAAVNDALKGVERAFLLPDGLPGRPWFRHALYAPGVTTGYASWPLPGVRQAIEESNPEMLKEQLEALVRCLDAATEALGSATAAAGSAG